MILQYILRVKRNGLISANSWLYCELDENVLPAIKKQLNKNSCYTSECADMANKSSMYRAIKAYITHKLVLFLLNRN